MNGYLRLRILFTSLLFFALQLMGHTFVYGERKTFTFSADSTTANLAKGKEFTLLQGNAQVVADDVEIKAGEIKLYGDDFQYASVTGRFESYDRKNEFSLEGNELFYDRRKKILRAEGNIVMKDSKNDVVIRASFLESKEDGKLVVVQLGIRITKSDELSARCEFLTYYRDTEELEMMGFPFALWKGDRYRARVIMLNLDTDTVRLEGEVSGAISTVTNDEGEKDEEESSATFENKGGEEENGKASNDEFDAEVEKNTETNEKSEPDRNEGKKRTGDEE